MYACIAASFLVTAGYIRAADADTDIKANKRYVIGCISKTALANVGWQGLFL